MKKLLFVLVVAILSVGLVACSDDTSNKSNNNANASDKKSTGSEKKKVSDTTFENEDYKFVIKNTEQLKSQYDDKQVLALEIEFTNKKNEPQDPWFAIAMSLNSEQETDKTVEPLDGANGLYPKDYKPELVEMGDTEIKSGATVDAIVGYEIKYPGKPVKLVDDSKTFERVIKTKKQ